MNAIYFGEFGGLVQGIPCKIDLHSAGFPFIAILTTCSDPVEASLAEII
jgi:hypothetical protein